MDSNKELCDAGLVNIREYGNNIICDIKYATTDNLMSEILYESPACYLLRPVADALNEAQTSLAEQGLSIKIWDAYRPIAVQQKLVSFVADTDYTPNVSNHSRGIALDVTLVDSATGTELIMPTAHDDLTERAHQDAEITDPTALRNRELLKRTMSQHGFTVYPYEWWHYDFLSMSGAEPLNIRI